MDLGGRNRSQSGFLSREDEKESLPICLTPPGEGTFIKAPRIPGYE